jgi:hypothetical protein
VTIPAKITSRPLLPIALTLCALLIGIQFVRPQLANRPATAELQVPVEVRAILQTSCYSCHSNQSKLSWFDQIVPAYWIVVRDVTAARKHLNFSEIGRLPPAQQKGLLFEAVNQIRLGAMPLRSYEQLHPESVVTPEQVAVLERYVESISPESDASIADIGVADAQYGKWISAGNLGPAPVAAAANGVEFIPDYKNWKAISSTDRFDNHTTRAILGNEIAVRAIAEKHINPWPDGTAFAKVSWYQQKDQQVIRTGAFQQVEFMIRDSKKFASTKNWGWARFRGMDLTPYGKDANFAEECVSCHLPVRQNDYVYTMPIEGWQ